MKIKVNFLGMLSKYTDAESLQMELCDGARYADLLAEIGRRYGGKFPRQCWDAEKNEFKAPISAIGSSGDIESLDAPLSGNDEINFLIPISGGKKE